MTDEFPAEEKKKVSRYAAIIGKIFADRYKKGATEIQFAREEIEKAAGALDIKPPKNLGDVPYSFRYRRDLPQHVLDTQPAGKEWIIRGVPNEKGQPATRYRFKLVPATKLEPQGGLYRTKIPDSTPQIVLQNAKSDEQAVLAKLRYNRLIDVFLGVVAYSLQNHLRSRVETVQLEIDELYVGINKTGTQFVIPVQAKGPHDRPGRVQLEQDLAYCRQEYPNLVPRAVAAKLMTDDGIAMFELTIDNNDAVVILNERHYQLVPAKSITSSDLRAMRTQYESE